MWCCIEELQVPFVEVSLKNAATYAFDQVSALMMYSTSACLVNARICLKRQLQSPLAVDACSSLA